MDDSVQEVRQVWDKGQRLSVRMIGEECKVPKTIVHRICTVELQVRKSSTESPDESDQGALFIEVPGIECYETDPELLDRVITGDETFILSLIWNYNVRVASGTIRSLFTLKK